MSLLLTSARPIDDDGGARLKLITLRLLLGHLFLYRLLPCNDLASGWNASLAAIGQDLSNACELCHDDFVVNSWLDRGDAHELRVFLIEPARLSDGGPERSEGVGRVVELGFDLDGVCNELYKCSVQVLDRSCVVGQRAYGVERCACIASMSADCVATTTPPTQGAAGSFRA